MIGFARGERSGAVGTMRLAPSRCAAFCHVKSPDRVLHFANVMMRELTRTVRLQNYPFT